MGDGASQNHTVLADHGLGRLGLILEHNAQLFLQEIKKIYEAAVFKESIATVLFMEPVVSILDRLLAQNFPNPPETAYGLYVELRKAIDKLPDPDTIGKISDVARNDLANLFQVFYAPDIDLLQSTEKLILTLPQKRASKRSFKSYFTHPESLFYKVFSSGLGFNFNPLTNLSHLSPKLMQESVQGIQMLRAGTPLTQVVPMKRGVSYSKGWLYYLWALKNQLPPQGHDEKKIVYLHINLQKTNRVKIRELFSLGRIVESQRSKRLHKMNQKAGVCAITLPADNAFFYGKCKTKHVFLLDQPKPEEATSAQDLFDQLKKNIINNKEDFYFTDAIKEKLELKKDLVLQGLYKKALKTITGKEELTQTLTPNQRQAVLFCFIKGELTQHILDTLQPKACSIACKDNIDRGAIHNAYFAMHKAFKDGESIDIGQWETLLKMPAMSVKGREINHHLHLLYNVLWQEYKQLPDDKQETFKEVLHWLVTEMRAAEPEKAARFFQSEAVDPQSSVKFRECLNRAMVATKKSAVTRVDKSTVYASVSDPSRLPGTNVPSPFLSSQPNLPGTPPAESPPPSPNAGFVPKKN
jgi:hypothetical protein